LPKAATRARKKRTSDDEDEDFVASEAITKKMKVIAKSMAKQLALDPLSRTKLL
jgi:hypothetical protein